MQSTRSKSSSLWLRFNIWIYSHRCILHCISSPSHKLTYYAPLQHHRNCRGDTHSAKSDIGPAIRPDYAFYAPSPPRNPQTLGHIPAHPWTSSVDPRHSSHHRLQPLHRLFGKHSCTPNHQPALPIPQSILPGQKLRSRPQSRASTPLHHPSLGIVNTRRR